MSKICRIKNLEDETKEKIDIFFTEPNEEKVTLIFTSRKWLEEVPSLRKRLFQYYKLPEYVWSDVCKRLQGYFGSEDTTSEEDGTIMSHVTWFHFEVKFPYKEDNKNVYQWYKMGVATSWVKPDNHTIIFFDAAKTVQTKVKRQCEDLKESAALRNPYWAHQFILEPITTCYDKAVWNLRDQVRELEDHRRAHNGDPREAAYHLEFNGLHEILRHALHATETLGVACHTLDSICARRKTFDEENNCMQAGVKSQGKKIAGYLEFQLSILRSLEARARANAARIRNEIKLAFSTVAQRDSQVQAEIGQAAQADSSAMKAIAVVTMIFLPSTAVSAIMSTSFFDFKVQEGQDVSKSFWVYWIITIPLTFVVVAVWYAWEFWHPGQKTRAAFHRKNRMTTTGQLC